MKLFLRKLSFIEGISLLLLFFVAMPVKYIAGEPILVQIVGMAHGILFLLLVAVMLYVARADRWSNKFLAFGLLTSTLPFGMIALDRKLQARWGAASSPG